MASRVEYHGDGTATVWVDIDPKVGDDKNSGKKGEDSVKTLKRSRELLEAVPEIE